MACADGTRPFRLGKSAAGLSAAQLAACAKCPARHAGSRGACALCANGKQPRADAKACEPCAKGWAGKGGVCDVNCKRDMNKVSVTVGAAECGARMLKTRGVRKKVLLYEYLISGHVSFSRTDPLPPPDAARAARACAPSPTARRARPCKCEGHGGSLT